jgi:probable phosphoglycerate mutase
MRRLLVLRHGQTDYNVENRAQGHRDVPLNDTGRSQAKAVAPMIAGYEPAFIWSSDLARARETAEIVAAQCLRDVRTDARLREFSVGVAREGRTWAEFEAAFPDQAASLRAGDFDAVEGAESPAVAVARFVPALHEAAEAVGEGEVGLVVAHGAVLRTAVLEFVGAAEAGHVLGALDNCGFALLEDSTSGFVPVAADGQWRIRAWNRGAHSG